VKRRLAAGAVVVLGTLFAGCGSSPLTTSELHNDATRVCRLANRQIDQIATPTSPAGTLAFLRRGIAALTPELAGLRSLHPSSDVADVYTAAVKSLGQQLAYLTDAMRDLKNGEDPVIALKTLQQELAPVVTQANGGWDALQIPACLSR
jgi:outer membrane murein-binding lipoprotein Lpp